VAWYKTFAPIHMPLSRLQPVPEPAGAIRWRVRRAPKNSSVLSPPILLPADGSSVDISYSGGIFPSRHSQGYGF
jgi:hypothetical protein